MTISTAVKWAVSSMTGAPTLNGTAGSLIAVLDAFLVNGFGTKAVDSAVVSNGICRMAITGGSAALDHTVIQVAGVTGDGVVLNGLQRVSTATGYVEFACDLPDGPLTGTITFKIAPLGWEKVFSKTNVAVYRSTDPSGTRAYYRVDDTNALYARVQMYESMSDVDNGLAAAPTSVAGGYYWYKRQIGAATGVYWVVAGDSRSVLVGVAPHASVLAASANGYGAYMHLMGDLLSLRSGDAWCATLSGSSAAVYDNNDGCIFSTSGTTGLCVQRISAGLGGAVAASRRTFGGVAVSGADSALGAYPSRAANGLHLSPILISDGPMANNGPRGAVAGAAHCPQTNLVATLGVNAQLMDGTGEYAGRKLMSVGCGMLSGAATGCGFVDVTGPWRA